MINIRTLEPRDIPFCLEIYNYYIVNTTYSFEELPLSEEAFEKRTSAISAKYPYIVAEEDGKIIGCAYLAEFSERTAYRFTADLSIYLDKGWAGKGIGKLLISEIEARGKAMGIKNIIAIITEQNCASVAFHQKHGYTVCGDFSDVGYKFGQWLGVKYLIKRI